MSDGLTAGALAFLPIADLTESRNVGVTKTSEESQDSEHYSERDTIDDAQ